MKERKRIFVAVIEKHTLNGANTITLMRRKHRCMTLLKSTRTDGANIIAIYESKTSSYPGYIANKIASVVIMPAWVELKNYDSRRFSRPDVQLLSITGIQTAEMFPPPLSTSAASTSSLLTSCLTSLLVWRLILYTSLLCSWDCL